MPIYRFKFIVISELLEPKRTFNCNASVPKKILRQVWGHLDTLKLFIFYLQFIYNSKRFATMYFYNVNHLHFYGLKTINRFDLSRRLNSVKNPNVAYYKYQGKKKIWFLKADFLHLIIKKEVNNL